MVCTLGPASRSPEKIAALIQAGMDVARLHFSYGTHSEHRVTIRRLRTQASALNCQVAILQDLCGAKIRMKEFKAKRVNLENDTEFTLTARDVEGDASIVSLNLPEMVSVVESGDPVLLNDGALQLRVVSTTDTDIRCKVKVGGRVKSQQAIHLPGRAAPVPVPTPKDREDVRFGLQQQVDWIAQSYVRSADEIQELRALIRKEGASARVVAKIERREAIEDLGRIIEASDAVMVARGDLGLELPIEQIGVLQKDIIQMANAAGKPVITATEMLVSMMEQPRPTRAEVTDITNAIFDGTDAVMLSGESAVGRYPVEAARMMARVIAVADSRVNVRDDKRPGQ
jgi:pyruvate kinase